MNTLLGLAVIDITAIVTILTSRKGHEDWVIVLSTAGGVIASAQTFLTPSQRTNAHKSAGAAYSSIRRSIEKAYAASTAEASVSDQCDRIEAQLNEQAAKCPTIPIPVWWRGESKYKKRL